MDIHITVTGLDNVTDMLGDVTARVANMSPLTEAIAREIEGQAKRNALSGHGHHAGGYPNAPTGNMAGSVYSSLSSPVTAIVGVGAYYAPYVEFGHAIHNAGRGKHRRNYIPHTWARAYPWFFPAMAQSRDKIVALVKQFFRRTT